MATLPKRVIGTEFDNVMSNCNDHGITRILGCRVERQYDEESTGPAFSLYRALPLAEYIRWEIGHLYAIKDGEIPNERVTIVLAVKKRNISRVGVSDLAKVLRDAAHHLHLKGLAPTYYMITEYASDRRTFFLGQGEKLIEPIEVKLQPR